MYRTSLVAGFALLCALLALAVAGSTTNPPGFAGLLTSPVPSANDEFGISVAIDGDLIAVGSSGDGALDGKSGGGGVMSPYDFLLGRGVECARTQTGCFTN